MTIFMMFHTIFYLVSLLGGTAIAPQEAETDLFIEGQITGKSEGKVFLLKQETIFGTHAPADTIAASRLNKGHFVFKNKVSASGAYALFFESTGQRIIFWADEKPVKLKGTLSNIIIDGSEDAARFNDFVNRYIKLTADVLETQKKAIKFWGEGKEAETEEAKKLTDSLNRSSALLVSAFFNNFSDQAIAAEALWYLQYDLGREKTLKFYNCLSGPAISHPASVQLKYKLFDADSIFSEGSAFHHFQQPDTTGANISTGSFKGKYLLIDFWASWCGPCRSENPVLKKLYAQYRERGFEILGVSLDNTRKKWIEAINRDMLPWSQVSDLRGGSYNKAAKLYGIDAIPRNYLLDPEGFIIAKNIHGKDLTRKLEDIFR